MQFNKPEHIIQLVICPELVNFHNLRQTQYRHILDQLAHSSADSILDAGQLSSLAVAFIERNESLDPKIIRVLTKSLTLIFAYMRFIEAADSSLENILLDFIQEQMIDIQESLTDDIPMTEETILTYKMMEDLLKPISKLGDMSARGMKRAAKMKYEDFVEERINLCRQTIFKLIALQFHLLSQ